MWQVAAPVAHVTAIWPRTTESVGCDPDRDRLLDLAGGQAEAVYTISSGGADEQVLAGQKGHPGRIRVPTHGGGRQLHPFAPLVGSVLLLPGHPDLALGITDVDPVSLHQEADDTEPDGVVVPLAIGVNGLAHEKPWG